MGPGNKAMMEAHCHNISASMFTYVAVLGRNEHYSVAYFDRTTTFEAF